MRRVATIAMVHETLSGTLDELVHFDDLVARSARMAADIASPGVQVKIVREGDFGMIPAQYASSLALIITELVTNAVEHGFEGREHGSITISAERDGVDAARPHRRRRQGHRGRPERTRLSDRAHARHQRAPWGDRMARLGVSRGGHRAWTSPSTVSTGD